MTNASEAVKNAHAALSLALAYEGVEVSRPSDRTNRSVFYKTRIDATAYNVLGLVNSVGVVSFAPATPLALRELILAHIGTTRVVFPESIAPEPAWTAVTADTSNALVAQADELRLAIRKASDGEELFAVLKRLDFVAPMWTTLSYAYKATELRRLIKSHAGDLLAEEEAFLSKERKNSRVRSMTLKNIKDLTDLTNLS